MQTYPRLHLLGLPQELQDIIFEYAHRRSSVTSVISRNDFETRNFQTQKWRGLGSFTTTYPGDKVSEFLLSKQYFLTAIRAYLSTGPFDLTRPKFCSGEPSWGTGVFAEFVKDVVGDDGTCDLVCHFPRLKTLHVSLTLQDTIRTSADVTLPLTLRFLSQNELATMWVAKSLEGLRGLSTLAIIPRQHQDHKLNPLQYAMLKSNLNMLCSLLRPKVTAERDKDKSCRLETDLRMDSYGFSPLYPGSKVSLHGSRIRQLVTRHQLAEALKDTAYKLKDGGIAPQSVECAVLCMLEKELERADHVGIDIIKRHSLTQAGDASEQVENELQKVQVELLNKEREVQKKTREALHEKRKSQQSEADLRKAKEELRTAQKKTREAVEEKRKSQQNEPVLEKAREQLRTAEAHGHEMADRLRNTEDRLRELRHVLLVVVLLFLLASLLKACGVFGDVARDLVRD